MNWKTKKKMIDLEDLRSQGCVYFFKHRGVDGVKIGYSNHPEPSGRFESFKTYCPTEPLLLGFITTSKAKELETKLHRKFKQKRMNGEWFDISFDEVNSIILKESTEQNLVAITDFYLNYSKYLDVKKDKPKNQSEKLPRTKFESFAIAYIENPKISSVAAGETFNVSSRTIQRWKKQLDEQK